MAIIKQCDFCNESFKPYGYTESPTSEKPNSIMLVSRSNDNNRYRAMNIFDICPNCMKQFEKMRRKEDYNGSR